MHLPRILLVVPIALLFISIAANPAETHAVPAGIFLAGRDHQRNYRRSILFLPLFMILLKLIRRAMKADADAILSAFGKNDQVKKYSGPCSL